MNSFASSSFWDAFNGLPAEIRKQAVAKFHLWERNHYHPGLHFKCVNSGEQIWSVRINIHYRALGIREGDDIVWFWIGAHSDYEKLI